MMGQKRTFIHYIWKTGDGAGLIDLLIGSIFVTMAGMALMSKVATVNIDQKRLEQRLRFYNVAQSISSTVASMSSQELYNLLSDEERVRGESLGVGLSDQEQSWITYWQDSNSQISKIYLYIKIYKSLSPKVEFSTMEDISGQDELKEYPKEIVAEVIPQDGKTVEHTIWVEQEL
ncbi:MAG: hypothetical protein HN353_11630 [Bdellovibrionales bacterium]|jgi:hypothetical protein|nr:hypothetical protein [Bdellovibrionales bacterium]MBT3526799.1 hypothetical protein [Bdellovibrionales bacterium]MBT7669997.1 hypothetical protein [Bdellovibrionales bacterium]